MPSALSPLVAAGFSLGLALAISACSSPFSGNCTSELRVRLSPEDTTVAAGHAFSPTVALSTCSGRQRLEDSFAFESSDAAVAAVDSATGRVTAVGTGRAEITITGQRYGQVGRILVTVSP